jgi:hypothetical protein
MNNESASKISPNRLAIEGDENRGRTMSILSNIIRSLLKVSGFMAFILLGASSVFSDNRIKAERQGANIRQGATIRTEQPAAISGVRTPTAASDAPISNSSNSSSVLTEVEPLLLLLFGLLLFSVATGIRLKLLKG